MGRKPHFKAKNRRGETPNQGLILYGRHAVTAALANPRRRPKRLVATQAALDGLENWPKGLTIEAVDAKHLAKITGDEAVHQGLVLYCEPLESVFLEDVLGHESAAPLLVLDQVTDPQNVGAIMRSSAAFGAAALITQDRHSPPESPALAKAASGALEILPWIRVVNLARALEQIAAAGYWRIGLDGSAETPLAQALNTSKNCLVLGAEGAGLRPNTQSHCDQLARLPISKRVESLNVANAAAVALYAASNL